ncbi:DUF3343 domain-containing protein [Campylobacter sp. RM12327]|uniref:Protein of uncharacterized function (DUF3343) n=1 Tax=Campylobacter sputorum subsp. sputorum TaxID=32024 RepID=A0A381DIS9_9BACT|nr:MULTISPECIES: DUF3343 domain-containing protein [Campylobacter]ASM35424.1 DUF3343 domain protein [Campylobacter sputorum aubsp. sputorum RM3237]ASM37120.1 DUF3343 domain protein [Campylobacter sputorum bv. faecalis CCUG 20703]ASM38791.1 DUF3343 domain protein [Campylobacter sputorum bv. paraureolyticus LMG 11764]ASM40375.1 DUF3343 domain protein [Campylobacter sputorum]KAB0582834.1 DUF3343 domain-containing protein [Campylobacter sputorum subsp. sputorum]
MTSGYITFPTSAGAFATEKILRANDIKVKLISTPRFLSSSCGVSAYFCGANVEDVYKILQEYDLEFNIKEYVDEYIEKRMH